MKAEDLMIGNWVYNKFTNKPVRLSEQDFFRRGGMFFLEPIPLTEETIVELLGFEKLHWDTFTKGEIIIDWDYKTITINENECTLPKHVHKLQQLIKSLED